MTTPRATADGLRWEQRQRLALFEAALLWRGVAGTPDLTDVFGISRVQASNDIGVYRDLFPGNIVYNATRKRYEPAPGFRPRLVRGSADEFLPLLAAGAGTEDQLVLLGAVLPPVEVVRPPSREAPLALVQLVARAVREAAQVRGAYQSLARPERREVRLWPHALAFNGFRWHARCFSEEHGEFRDFVLARFCGRPRVRDGARPAAAEPARDAAWTTTVTVRIAPHPALSPAQAEVVAADWGMRQGELRVPVRGALAGYFLRLMRLDAQAENTELVLLNADELAPYVFGRPARPTGDGRPSEDPSR